MYSTFIDRDTWNNVPERSKELLNHDPVVSFGYWLSTKSVKAEKAEKFNYLNAIQYLAPSNMSGVEHCPCKTSQCDPMKKGACLVMTGQLGMKSGLKAVLSRSLYLDKHTPAHKDMILSEVTRLYYSAKSSGKKLAIRLNGTSDLPFETRKYNQVLQALENAFPDVALYDYTKIPVRASKAYHKKKGLKNYTVCYSYDGGNKRYCKELLRDGGIVSVIFSGEIPDSLWGYPVINGDESDLRFLDSPGSIVGLTFKKPKEFVRETGKLRLAESFPAFVYNTNMENRLWLA